MAVRCSLLAYGIAYRKREVTLSCNGLAVIAAYLYRYLLVRAEHSVARLRAVCCHVQLDRPAVTMLQSLMCYEEVALCKRRYAVGEDDSTVDAFAKTVLGECETAVACRSIELPVVAHRSAVQQNETQFHIVAEVVVYVDSYVPAVILDAHYNTLFLGFWQVEFVFLLLLLAVRHCHLGAVPGTLFRGNHKRTLSHM